MEFYLMAQGIPVHVSDSEKGDKTIVLLHGYLETLNVWESFAALLSKQYRVVMIDLPGHGLSGTKGEEHSMEFMADVLHEVFQKRNLSTAFIVGHSMGGYVALAFAEKYPENASGLCLFHSTPNADTDEKKTNREREIELIKHDKLDLIILNNIGRQFANDNVARLSEKIADIQEDAFAAEDEGIIACLNGMKTRTDKNDFLKQYNKPCLLLFGKKDNYIPEEVAKNLIERFPNAHAVLLENSGHTGFIEEPEQSFQAIDDFMKTIK